MLARKNLISQTLQEVLLIMDNKNASKRKLLPANILTKKDDHFIHQEFQNSHSSCCDS